MSRLAPLVALAALLSATAGCFDPIVGARCAEGYVPCHGRCVAVCDGRDDGGGGSGRDTGAGGTTDSGAATGDASSADSGVAPDGSTDNGSSSNDGGATASDAAAGDGTTAGPDAAAGDDSAPTSPADAGVTDAATADGTTADAGPSPDAPPPIDCGTLTLCPAGCVNLDDDPDNCGSCGYSCGTGLCVNGVCQQRQAGHLVVIGHDYAVSRAAMDTLVGNAVFLAPRVEVNVLAYQSGASDDEIRGTDNAIQRVASATGRTWRKTVAAAADVPAGLATADVLLIYAQSNAGDSTLLALGTSWATALSDFVRAGHTIVLCEGFYPNGGTYQIVQQANLFHATGRHEATGQTLLVARPGDAVATRVPQTYRAERSTVWFETSDPTVVVQVVTDAGLQPVVIHLVF